MNAMYNNFLLLFFNLNFLKTSLCMTVYFTYVYSFQNCLDFLCKYENLRSYDINNKKKIVTQNCNTKSSQMVNHLLTAFCHIIISIFETAYVRIWHTILKFRSHFRFQNSLLFLNENED